MTHWKALGSVLFGVLGLAAAPGSAAGQFVTDNAKIPNEASYTENIDFGDVDLDGDWDAVVADGGDQGNDQNRLWLNRGGLQGGPIGSFVDVTAQRLPVLADDSRDVELADIDGDGDLDWYTSNTAQLSNQGNRWWINLGGKQGGTPGFFADETGSRWVNLGGPGSSIAPSLVIGSGENKTFIDWSCDCDFGDLDNDGDLDLVHSTYGGSFGGQVPTRIFLNDGDGFFEEFNPSGFQLFGAQITNGQPGLWCDGVQQANTTDFTGQFCDIATTALDIDLGDIDGDFDLDILHGARIEAPRMFANRLDGSSLAPAVGGGQLGFRDVTGLVFPPGYTSGSGHYEQEMGDFDMDGDLDIYGLNWRSVFVDVTLENKGDGTFEPAVNVPGSGADDNEADFFDYDNDGDLDVYVANFSGGDRLYRNNFVESGKVAFSLTPVSLPFVGRALDADACDTDGDGDYDVLVSRDGGFVGTANTFLRNVTETPDTHAPYLPNIETIGDRTATAEGVPVRVHVYDNAPYYITWYNPTVLEVAVDGIDLPPLNAMSSQGQVFRGVLPGNLVGSVDYRFRSEDEYGNAGTSPTKSYTSTFGGSFATTFGTGTSGTTGGEPTIQALSVPFAASTVYLAGSSGAAPGTTAVLAVSTQKLDPGILVPGLLHLNLTGGLLALHTATLDANGDVVLPILVVGAVPPGVKAFAQFFVQDPTASGEVFASSKGLEITTQ